MGRCKKYTSGRMLYRALENYFSSISRIKQVMEERVTGERDNYGHFIKEWVPVRNNLGEIMVEREFLIPPTVGGLCSYLKISRVTWLKYCDKGQNPQFAEATEWAKEQLLSWREKELLSRRGQDLKGLMFDLRMNYGMSEKGSPVSAAQDDDPITRSLKASVPLCHAGWPGSRPD